MAIDPLFVLRGTPQGVTTVRFATLTLPDTPGPRLYVLSG